MKIRSIFINFIKQVFFFFISVSVIYPLFFLVITSLKSRKEYIANRLGFPQELYFQNFIEIFKKTDIILWLRNTFLISVISVGIVIFISILAAYAFSMFKFKFKKIILNIYISLQVISPIIIVIPLFILFNKLNLINNFISPIIVYIGMMLLWTTYMLKTFFDDIPRTILESAIVDGCNRFRMIFAMIIPLSKPIIATLIIANFLFVWNELLISLVFLQKGNLRTLMVGLSYFRSLYQVNIPLTMVGLIVAIFPLIMLYIFGQKVFIENLTKGYSKGGE